MFFLTSKLLKTIPQVSNCYLSSYKIFNQSLFNRVYFFKVPTYVLMYYLISSYNNDSLYYMVNYVLMMYYWTLLNNQAAATTCYVATHARMNGISGKYFADCNEASPSKLATSSTEAARLWSASEVMVTSPDPKLGAYPSHGFD